MKQIEKILTENKDILLDKVEMMGLEILSSKSSNADPSIYWAYPTYMNQIELPLKGFKLYISATLKNSSEIFDIAIPYLISKRLAFKLISSHYFLKKLNENHFGESLIGKFITVYTLNNDHAIELGHELDLLLKKFSAPKIPSSFRIHPESIVHYQYGELVKN